MSFLVFTRLIDAQCGFWTAQHWMVLEDTCDVPLDCSHLDAIPDFSPTVLHRSLVGVMPFPLDLVVRTFAFGNAVSPRDFRPCVGRTLISSGGLVGRGDYFYRDACQFPLL